METTPIVSNMQCDHHGAKGILDIAGGEVSWNVLHGEGQKGKPMYYVLIYVLLYL